MKTVLMLGLGLLAAGAGCSALAVESLNSFRPKVLPVLVQVDAHGHVTGVSPSFELAPRMEKLLRSNLDELIAGPGKVHGQAVASQMVVNLALKTSPQPDGTYTAQFAYVSSTPVPSGQWFWVHEDGHRLALVNRDAEYNRRRNLDRVWRDRTGSHTWPAPASPAVQPAATGPERASAASARSFRRH